MLLNTWFKSVTNLPSMTPLFLACNGATTGDLWNSGHTANGTEPQQLQDSGGLSHARIVTVSVGGDDLGFSSKLFYCLTRGVLGDCTSAHPIVGLASAISALGTVLKATYAKIKAETPKDASLFVVGYPDIFSAQATTDCSGLTSSTLSAANQTYLASAEAALNGEIYRAANAVGAQYVDPNMGPYSFIGHDICSSNSWFNRMFHPSSTGQEAMALTIESVLNPGKFTVCVAQDPSGSSLAGKEFTFDISYTVNGGTIAISDTVTLLGSGGSCSHFINYGGIPTNNANGAAVTVNISEQLPATSGVELTNTEYQGVGTVLFAPSVPTTTFPATVGFAIGAGANIVTFTNGLP